MDYIDRYRKAQKNEFSTSEDEKAREDFYKGVRKDIYWARNNSLINDLSFEEYLELKNRTNVKVTEEMRRVILSELDIPADIIAQYYSLPPSSVYNMRKRSRERAKREEAKC